MMMEPILRWARFGARLRENQTVRIGPAIAALTLWSKLGAAHTAHQAAQIGVLLQRSRDRLAPFDDPLVVDFGLNRWLSNDREEAYSDWLAWILRELHDEAAVRSLLFGENSSGPAGYTYQVDREVWVPEGHEGRAGRLDCVIYLPDGVIVLELKTTTAERSDTAKHEGYLNWLNRQNVRERRGFLIADSNEDTKSYSGFDLIRWEHLCKRARTLIRGLIEQKRMVLAALICAFVGAVEQNILRYPFIGDQTSLRSVSSSEFVRLIAYLTDCHS